MPDDLDELVPIPAGRLDYPCRIGKYPVTNFQYQRFRPIFFQDNVRFNRFTQPVVAFSWNEAVEYCQWLTGTWRREGMIVEEEVVRLPKEVEWAAAGGPHRYAWGDNFDTSLCNSKESDFGQPSPVHMYPNGATDEGVHDLCGNVWEWMLDDHEDYKGAKVLRGGAYYRDADGVPLAARHLGDPDLRYLLDGFRVVVVPIARA